MIGGAWITEARERAELTRDELALRSGYSVEQVEDWEYNRVPPTYDVIRELAALCGWLFGGRLDPLGDGSDIAMIQYCLSLTPGERVERGVRMANFALRNRGVASR